VGPIGRGGGAVEGKKTTESHGFVVNQQAVAEKEDRQFVAGGEKGEERGLDQY